MQLTTCFFLSALVFAASADWTFTTKLECSEQIEDLLGFGSRFQVDISELLNKAFSSKASCLEFGDFLRRKLGTYIDFNQWNSLDESDRRKLANKLIPLLHYRSMMAEESRGNLSSQERLTEEVLQSKLFASNLFEVSDDLQQNGASCSQRVQQSLQVFEPLVAELSAYLDSFNSSICSIFVGKLKSSLLELTRLSNSDWLSLSNLTKSKIVKGLFPVMHTHGNKPSITKLSSSERIWKELSKHEVFLGDIFASVHAVNLNVSLGSEPMANLTANSTGPHPDGNLVSTGEHHWRILLWVVMCLTVGIVIFLGLRFLNVIPSFASN